MKIFTVILSCLVSFCAAAEVSEMNLQNKVKSWSVEGQLNTASNSTTSTFGPSMFYRLDEKNLVGFRLLSPLSWGEGTLSQMAVYRHLFGIEKTSLFGEVSLASNQYSVGDTELDSPSAGTNFGIIHRLNEDISFGGLAGMEWTHVELHKNSVSDAKSDLNLYGRLALFGSVAF